MAIGNSFKLWFIPTSLVLILSGCRGIQFIPMEIESQINPRQFKHPESHAGFNESDAYLLIERSIKDMVFDFTVQNPDIVTIAVRDFQVISGQLYHGIIEKKLVDVLVESKALTVVSMENGVQNQVITKEIHATDTFVYGLGSFYYDARPDGYLDGYILIRGRLYTLNLKLIHSGRNDVIWSKTVKWLHPK